MDLKYIDHVAQALERMPSQWEDKPKAIGLITAIFENYQLIEDTLKDLNEKRGINTAEGVQLDVIGALVGEPRRGRPDNSYRSAIYQRIAINTSDATGDNLLEVIQLVSGDPYPQFQEHFPARIIAHANVAPSPAGVRALDAAVAAGVAVEALVDTAQGDCFIAAHAFSPTEIEVFKEQSFLPNSIDIDDGFPANPLAYAIHPDGPEGDVSFFELDTGDILELDDGTILSFFT